MGRVTLCLFNVAACFRIFATGLVLVQTKIKSSCLVDKHDILSRVGILEKFDLFSEHILYDDATSRLFGDVTAIGQSICQVFWGTTAVE